MAYYSQPGSYIKDKVIVILKRSNYAIKKESEYAAVIDTSNLVAKKDFTALKSGADLLDIE